MKNFNFKSYKFWLLIAALIFTFLLVYSPHFNYSYPLHIDEWIHIEYTKRLLNQEYNLHHELGYQIFLVIIFSVLKFLHISPILTYKFLPAIFAVFAAIFLFLLMYKLTKNYWVALFSIIFLASLPSNVNLLGLWFAVPLTLAIPLLYLFFYFYTKAFQANENNYKKQIIIASIILFLTALIHPSTAALLFPILIIHATINYKEIKTKPGILIVFLPFLLAGIWLLKILWMGNLNTTKDYIKYILQFNSIEILEPSITQNPLILTLGNNILLINQNLLPVLYRLIPFALALLGLFFSLKTRKLRIFAIWFLTTIFLLFTSNFTGTSFLARSQRMTYYALLSLVPLSALGLHKLISYLRNKLTYNFQQKTIYTIMTIILIITLFSTFYNYGKQRQGTELYHLIDNADYEALTFLSQQEPGLVLAPLTQAATVYAISQNEVIARFWPIIGKEKVVEIFFSSSCQEKQVIIKEHNVDYVYSLSPINCGWKEIYNQNKFIYKTS